MNAPQIRQLSALEPVYHEQTSKLLVDSFGYMFQGVSRNKQELYKLFAPCLQKELVYVLLENQNVAGFIAVSNSEKRAIIMNEAVCVALFGKFKGHVLSWQLGKMLSTPAVDNSANGYVDFLATAPNFQRKGVAAQLLAFSETMGYAALYLDVLASNTAAISLYNKMGYETECVKNTILMRISGVKPMYIMKKTCDGAR